MVFFVFISIILSDIRTYFKIWLFLIIVIHNEQKHLL